MFLRHHGYSQHPRVYVKPLSPLPSVEDCQTYVANAFLNRERVSDLLDRFLWLHRCIVEAAVHSIHWKDQHYEYWMRRLKLYMERKLLK